MKEGKREGDGFFFNKPQTNSRIKGNACIGEFCVRLTTSNKQTTSGLEAERILIARLFLFRWSHYVRIDVSCERSIS